MADPKDDLPEGTDKIINGAMETGQTAEPAGRTERIATGGGRDAILDKVRSGGEKLSTQAADKARGLVGQGLERGAEALANVGKLVGETADGLDERLGEDYGNYARRAAGAIEGAANSLASKDPDELVDDTREFIRKSPGVALAGAAIAGFAIARLIKSGLSRDESDKDGGGGRKKS